MAAVEPLLGSISMFAGDFAPRGWAFCAGQLLSVSQNSALFSLLGTRYGGDGRTTFGLPDLRGRVPLGGSVTNGPGLSNYQLGNKGGVEEVALLTTEIPSHTHTATVTAGPAAGTVPVNGEVTIHVDTTNSTSVPTNKFLSEDTSVNMYGSRPNETLNSGAATFTGSVDLSSIPAPSVTNANTGGGIAHENRQPYLAISYIIAVQGVYPSRS